jgi:uncharacterized protein YebE (UPF0316 family)
MLTQLGLDSPQALSILLPIAIFCARIVDVSLGTVRIVLVGRGQRTAASVLGFLEVFIWLVTISQVLQNMHGIVSYFFYSAGFGAGTFVGMSIERRLALGKSIIRFVTAGDTRDFLGLLSKRGFRLTRVKGEGSKGPVDVVFSVVNRRSVNEMLALLKTHRPDAFYSIEDVRLAKDFEPMAPAVRRRVPLGPFYWFRKSK